jgi:RimJ/RimL family protein N-acetyltransferase
MEIRVRLVTVPPEVVSTARLDLVLLSIPAYRALVDGRLAEAERLIGARLGSSGLGDSNRTVRRRLAQLERGPEELPWLLRAMVLRAQREVVGQIGFHAPPDAEGMVEIGYRVAEHWRRRGLAAEAVLALWEWAAGQPGVRRLRASIAPGNVASLAIAARLGLVEVGRQIDEEDGEEIVFETAAGPSPEP